MRLNTNLVIVTLVLFVCGTHIAAQSTNQSSPTPLNGSYTGKGPSNETNFYFSFAGGPGDVSVKLDIKAKDYSTFARIEIGNDPSNLIAMANMNASTTTGAASVTKEFKLDEQQTIRIKLTLDGNLAEYTLSLNGGGPIFTGGGGNTGSAGSGKTGTVGKIGKLTTGGGAKLGKLGSSGSKPKTGTLGSSGGGKEMTATCPTEIEYQLVPVADWNAGLYGKKRLKFDSVSAEGTTIFCTYSANNGATPDSSTLMKKMPDGYVCSVYNGGPGSRIVTCTQGTTAEVSQ